MTVARHTSRVKKKNSSAAKAPPARRNNRWPAGYLSQEKAAALLGVHRTHLNRVLKGHRQSKRLLDAYAALLAKHQQQH